MEYKLSGFIDEIAPDFAAQVSAAGRLGLKWAELRGADGRFIGDWPEERQREMRKRLDERGIGVACLASPAGKTPAGADFEPAWERFARYCECAHIMGARLVRVFSFYIPEGRKADEYEGLAIERLGRMADYAEKEGLLIAHENEKGIYGDTASRCLRLAEALRGRAFTLVFDFANFVQCGEDTREAWRLLGRYTAHFHMKDALRATGGCVPCGEGDGNVAEILREAYGAGYGGFLSLEPHLVNFAMRRQLERADAGEGEEGDGEAAFAAAAAALRALLAGL
ncbi:MAG: sugar phosphate isomerase/epimerase [Oscillospiraceae bacterium]|nr:sugar phosphate isomerase/epimerase [Oscillospiraceae bacterium]